MKRPAADSKSPKTLPPDTSPDAPPPNGPPPVIPPKQIPSWEDIVHLSPDEKVEAIEHSWTVWHQKGLTEAEQDQAWQKAKRLEIDTRLADAAVDAHFVPPRRFSWPVPAPDDAPTPDQVIRRPGQAPRVPTVSPEHPERFLTYADIQDWPYPAQVEILTHVQELWEEIFKEKNVTVFLNNPEREPIYQLIGDACNHNESLKLVLMTGVFRTSR